MKCKYCKRDMSKDDAFYNCKKSDMGMCIPDNFSPITEEEQKYIDYAATVERKQKGHN